MMAIVLQRLALFGATKSRILSGSRLLVHALTPTSHRRKVVLPLLGASPGAASLPASFRSNTEEFS